MAQTMGVFLGFGAAVLSGLAASAALATGPNLLVNGDFEQGNVGFTTDYAYAPNGNTTEGQYTIRAGSGGWNGGFAVISDHTPAPGVKMMLVNGQDSGQILTMWRQSVAVTAGRRYEFSGWVATLVSGPSAVVRVEINGATVVPGYTASTTAGSWEEFDGTWLAAGSTADIRLVDLNTATFPNDFALDDLYFAPICPADFDNSGEVDDSDFVLFAQAYDRYSVPPAAAECDLNGDAVVDDVDFVLFAQAYDRFVCE